MIVMQTKAADKIARNVNGFPVSLRWLCGSTECVEAVIVVGEQLFYCKCMYIGDVWWFSSRDFFVLVTFLSRRKDLHYI